MLGAERTRFVVGTAVGLAVLTSAAVADPLGATEPSAQEQHGVYVLNRARHDPTKYGQQIGVDLSALTPRPPLAVNMNLTGSARFHAREMVDNDYFAHTSEVTGDGPDTMIVQNGYDLYGAGLGADYGTRNSTESIAFGVNSIPQFSDALSLLIIDKGVPGLGHRVHLMATSGGYAQHREVGFGRAQGTDAQSGRPKRIYAIHTGNVRPDDYFLTGVVYDDANRNGKYDLGEGVGGATIDIGVGQTQSMEAGGYAIKVSPGTYNLTCQGGSFDGQGSVTVTVTDASVEVDFRSGVRGAQVNFEDFVLPPFPGPDVSATGAPLLGPAPLAVDFTATSNDVTATYAWDFGDGGDGNGATPSHVYAQPGLYTALVSGTNADGTRTALAVVAVGDAAAPGTPPASSGLTFTKLVAKANFKKAGKDKVVAAFSMEMPEGFLPGDHTVAVNIGGVSVEIPITAKNKGVDTAGNKIVLKAAKKALKKADKSGTPIAAGVVAKVKVILKGDFAEMLGVAGLRNTDEVRTLEGFPVALLIDGHAYRAGLSVLQKSVEDKKSIGKLAP